MPVILEFALYVSAAWVALGTIGLGVALVGADTPRTIGARRRARRDWMQCAALIYLAGPACVILAAAIGSGL